MMMNGGAGPSGRDDGGSSSKVSLAITSRTDEEFDDVQEDGSVRYSVSFSPTKDFNRDFGN